MKSSVTSITGMKRDWDSFTIVSLTKFDIYQFVFSNIHKYEDEFSSAQNDAGG